MIVVGDIHGNFKTFEALLKKLPDDEIFLVGDTIDRGPRSKEVLDFLLYHPEIKSVLGNHEQVFLQSFNDIFHYNWWLKIGGRQTEQSYLGQPIPEEHISYINKLPPYIEKNNVFISHSIIQGSLEEATNNLDSENSILWARNGITKRINKCFHVFGHTPQKKPLIREYWANIDTGCFSKNYGVLTALQYPSMILFSQENID